MILKMSNPPNGFLYSLKVQKKIYNKGKGPVLKFLNFINNIISLKCYPSARNDSVHMLGNVNHPFLQVTFPQSLLRWLVIIVL